VALVWYITFLTKQWCKAPKRGYGISGKEGPGRLSRYLSLKSIPGLGICFAGKVHVTKMKLALNFFPLVLQIPQISYCIF